jgi:hypothetical protein
LVAGYASWNLNGRFSKDAASRPTARASGQRRCSPSSAS